MVIHSFTDLRASIPLARKERARTLRRLNLRDVDIKSVARYFGLCDTGKLDAVTRRVTTHIWHTQYDR